MLWWMKLVKMRREERGKLNLFLVRQACLVRKLHNGCLDRIKEHRLVQNEINKWYEE